MKAKVMKSTGMWYELLTEDGQKITSRIRGKIRLEGIKETNPVAVGDNVAVHIEKNEGVIDEILPRENFIVRKSVKKTSQGHVIAANLDQVMLIATLVQPRTSLGFIDRFFVAAESFRIPQVLVFNKVDILSQEQKTIQAELIELYNKIGVTCIETSALQIDQTKIKEILNNKTTLIAGHSGVGKSTLINQLSPDIKQKTASISDFSEKGIHTTTFAEMFQLDSNSFIIDTPGIKEFGLIDMTEQEISDYFLEMRDLRLDCKLGSKCLHLNEPKCAIIEAVKSGNIALSRYESYLSMVLGEDNRK